LKRLLSLLAAVVFTSAALAFALREADFARLWHTLGSGRHWVLLPFLALLTLFYLSNAARWRLLLRPFGDFGIRRLLPSMSIGFAANNLLPFRVGELIRVYLSARDLGQARSGLLMTLVLERMLDLSAILGIYAVALAMLPQAPALMRTGMWVAALAIAGIGIGLLTFAISPRRVNRLWCMIAAGMPESAQARGEAYLAQLARALTPLLVPSSLSMLAAQSVGRWLLAAGLAWLSLYAYGDAIAPELAMVVIGVTALAVSLPSVPGFVGPIQAAFVFALTPFGIARETALAASILFLLGHWVPVTLAGALMLASRHESLRRLGREASASE